MKKILALVVGVVLACSLVGCIKIDTGTGSNNSSDNSSSGGSDWGAGNSNNGGGSGGSGDSGGSGNSDSNTNTPAPELLTPIIVDSGWFSHTASDNSVSVGMSVLVTNPNPVPIYTVKLTATIRKAGQQPETVDLGISVIASGDTRVAISENHLSGTNVEVTDISFEVADFSGSVPSSNPNIPVFYQSQLLISQIVYSAYSEPPTISGTLTNNTGQDLSNIAVTVVFWSDNGQMMGTATMDSVYNAQGGPSIPAGSSGTFEILADSNHGFVPPDWTRFEIYAIYS